jgi:hypothetical protein
MLNFVSEADRELVKTFSKSALALAEAMTRLAKRKALKRVENRLERGMMEAFGKQGAAYLKVFREEKEQWPVQEGDSNLTPSPFPKGKGRIHVTEMARRMVLVEWREAIDSDEFADALDRADESVYEYFLGPLERAAKDGLELGARQLLAEIGELIRFDLKNPTALAYLKEHGAALISRLNKTTRAEVKVVLNHGLENGWSYKRTAGALQNLFKDYQTGGSYWNMDAPRPQGHIDSRAHLIAVTESGEAYEEGAFEAATELMDAGIELEKSWVTMGDDKVSEGCEENGAEGWIPFGQAHASGHMHPLRFPGCRCDEEYRRVDNGL